MKLIMLEKFNVPPHVRDDSDGCVLACFGTHDGHRDEQSRHDVANSTLSLVYIIKCDVYIRKVQNASLILRSTH